MVHEIGRLVGIDLVMPFGTKFIDGGVEDYRARRRVLVHDNQVALDER